MHRSTARTGPGVGAFLENLEAEKMLATPAIQTAVSCAPFATRGSAYSFFSTNAIASSTSSVSSSSQSSRRRRATVRGAKSAKCGSGTWRRPAVAAAVLPESSASQLRSAASRPIAASPTRLLASGGSGITFFEMLKESSSHLDVCMRHLLWLF